MGILDGYSIVNQWFLRGGLYQQKPKRYMVYVDGEFMRYKGMISENLSLADPEEAIAHTSFQCLNITLQHLECHLERAAKSVIVFMDGERVRNKVCDRPLYKYNIGLIRTTFMNFCMEMGYIVHELQYGEAELQMYLHRDRDNDLNVFMTNDSDMMSICYDHRPSIVPMDEKCTMTSDELYESIYEASYCSSNNNLWSLNLTDIDNTNATVTGIKDFSNTYMDLKSGLKYEIKDSCMWLSNKSSQETLAIGMDLCAFRIKLNERVFRTMLALAGSDFTSRSKMCTRSMIQSFLNADMEDFEELNNLSKHMYETRYEWYWNWLAAAILFLCVKSSKNGCTLTRLPKKTNTAASFQPSDVEHLLAMYYKYISTGIMTEENVFQSDMSIGTRHYLYALFGGTTKTFIKNQINERAKKMTLREATDNFILYFDTYEPNSCNKTRNCIEDTLCEVVIDESDVKNKTLTDINKSAVSTSSLTSNHEKSLLYTRLTSNHEKSLLYTRPLIIESFNDEDSDSDDIICNQKTSPPSPSSIRQIVDATDNNSITSAVKESSIASTSSAAVGLSPPSTKKHKNPNDNNDCTKKLKTEPQTNMFILDDY